MVDIVHLGVDQSSTLQLSRSTLAEFLEALELYNQSFLEQQQKKIWVM